MELKFNRKDPVQVITKTIVNQIVENRMENKSIRRQERALRWDEMEWDEMRWDGIYCVGQN